jgi:DNA (cytosine-5)-methyltransferase 1
VTGTLCSGPAQRGFSGSQEIFNGGYHVIEEHDRPVRYIVRRLTPTECARLQGFADRWGDIDEKDTFTPEEYAFWHEVRNTHAAINGKKAQEYTEAQMLTWYNKLHTDSSEYKMWGNGIALPCALYVMQGIAIELLKQHGIPFDE